MLDSATDLRSILKDPSLLVEQAYIAGEWVNAADGKTFAVINPARGDVIANVADMTREDARRAIEVADKARHEWAARTGKERAAIMRKWFDLMMENQDDLGRIRSGDFLISQAGYSWDTGAYLSGHMDCRIFEAYRDGSIIHSCDTTQGDSGSPIMTQVNGEWRLIAVDSQFFDPQPPFPQMSSSHLAVDTRAFIPALREAGALE
jgi:hypothetical protein